MIRAPVVAFVMIATVRVAVADEIVLDDALARAARVHPEIAIGAADVANARGQLQTAETWQFNPELDAALGPSRGGGATVLDWQVSLSQVIELGGKRGHRADAARSRAGGAEAQLRWTSLRVVTAIKRAFYVAQIARLKVTTSRQAETDATELKVAADERLRQKIGTQLELNVAVADAGRARRDRLEAERQYSEARAALGSAIGARGDEDLEPRGELVRFPEVGTTMDQLVAHALANRPDLFATVEEEQATIAERELADAQAIPDLRLAVSYGRSEGSDIVLFGVGIALPIFNRNQGGRASARALVARASIVTSTTRTTVERDVRTAYRNYQTARDAAVGFDRDVVEHLDQNLKLARDSFIAGEIGLLALATVRRELVDTRIAYLAALTEAADAWSELETASGMSLQ